MKPKAKFITLFLVILLICFSRNSLVGSNIKLLEEIKIPPGPESLKKSISFCVIDDELFIIPDYGAGNIKVYERGGERSSLEMVKIIGKKGYGPDGLAKPMFCFYNNDEYRLGVMDSGLRKILIFDRSGRTEFKRWEKEIYCSTLGYDIQLSGDRLFISGYKPNQTEVYDFYYIDLRDDQTVFLLPSYYKYGLRSFEDYENQYRNKPDIRGIGINGWFDIEGDGAYFIWEGDLKVVKINTETGEIINSFGKKTEYYIKPEVSENLLEGYNKGKIDIIERERARMSFVTNIFAGSNYILVIYNTPKREGLSNYRIQFYTLSGNFIDERPIPGQPGQNMWFDKERNILYSLCNQNSDDQGNYYLIKYEIE